LLISQSQVSHGNCPKEKVEDWWKRLNENNDKHVTFDEFDKMFESSSEADKAGLLGGVGWLLEC
jgi:hypothetical protein